MSTQGGRLWTSSCPPWKLAYGREEARIFLNEILTAAPDIAVQIAHLCGAGGFDDPSVDQALGVFVDAITNGDPRTKQLYFAVTGKMAGGLKVIRQTIDREDALIAYTRKNAYFVLQENDLGSIQAGKLADFVLLDRDYLTVPADQIKDIKPVMTVVGGKVVYDSEH